MKERHHLYSPSGGAESDCSVCGWRSYDPVHQEPFDPPEDELAAEFATLREVMTEIGRKDPTRRIQAIAEMVRSLPRCNNGSCQKIATHFVVSPFYVATCDGCAANSKKYFPSLTLSPFAPFLRALANALVVLDDEVK